MVACVVELVAKPGATEQLCARVDSDILELARQLPGFVDAFTLVCREEPRLVLQMTVWENSEYARAFDDAVASTDAGVRQLMDHKLRVQTYDFCNESGQWGRKVA